MEKFKPLPWYKEIFLKKSELAEYYVNKRNYLYENGKNKTEFKIQKKLHKLLIKTLELNRIFIDKQNFEIISDKRKKTNKNVIYAATHIGKFDYQILTEALRDHIIPFAGDPELTYRNIDGAVFNINGVVFIDTYSKMDRKVAYDTAISVLKNGYNLLIYPEGIWNLSPNMIVQPIYPGVIKMSIETGCEIVPVAIEQYDNKFLINIGENYSIENKEDIEQEKHILRDKLATLKYEIFERVPHLKARDEMNSYAEEKDNFVNTRLNEYKNSKTKTPYFTEQYIEDRIYKEKGVVKPKDAFSYFNDVQINEKTEFMFENDDSLPPEIQETIHERMKR